MMQDSGLWSVQGGVEKGVCVEIGMSMDLLKTKGIDSQLARPRLHK